MAQLFGPAANTVAKVSIVLLASLPVVVIYSGSAISQSPYNTKVGIRLDQPVPFSHAHHTVDLGIDCRYCHTSVERTAYSGIPQTETCMTCHSLVWTNSPLLEPVRASCANGEPIKWNLVNKAPEFVFFNHSIHIARGISCNNCHGAVQKMQITEKGRPFTMQWCLTCHNDPDQFLYKDSANPHLSPREQVFNLYVKVQEDPTTAKMSTVERKLVSGGEQSVPRDLVAEGKKLLQEYGIKQAQLADCATCHH